MTEDLTFASSGPAGVHYARCWSCKCGSHFDPPQRHDWADHEDIEHAAKTGQPSPVGKRCACPCADEPAATAADSAAGQAVHDRIVERLRAGVDQG